MLARKIALMIAVLVAGPTIADAQQAPPRQTVLEAPTMIANPYTAYEFLIGEWYSKPSGGPDIAIRQSFKYGLKKSSIFYTTSTQERGKPEAVHFEGMLVWNGATKGLDYVIASEPGSGAQEHGTMHVESDGTVVRDVTMVTAKGREQTFQQKFWKTGPDSVMTSLMRKTASGWEPNFPGSDKIAMSRTPL